MGSIQFCLYTSSGRNDVVKIRSLSNNVGMVNGFDYIRLQTAEKYYNHLANYLPIDVNVTTLYWELNFIATMTVQCFVLQFETLCMNTLFPKKA